MSTQSQIQEFVDALLSGASVSTIPGDEWDRARRGIDRLAADVSYEGTLDASQKLAAAALGQRSAEQISHVLSDDPRVQAIVLILSWLGIAELTHWLIQQVVEAVRGSDRRRLAS
jgi:hypothetical protein